MRILYFAGRECWPLTTGARLRNYHLARQLAARSSVTYAGLRDTEEQKPGQPPEDSQFERYITLVKDRSYTPFKLIRGLLGPVPVTILNYSSSSVGRDLAVILEEGRFDLVQIEGVHLMEYLPVIRSARSHPAILADWHNIESELVLRYASVLPSLPRRLVAKRTAYLIRRAEQRFLAACDAHVVASERERQELAARAPGATIHVVSNGVDVGCYTDEQIGRACVGSGHSEIERHEVLFVGSMDYHANIDAVTWFAREVWPELHCRYPSLLFRIVGRNPSAEVRRLASDTVHVTGTVEDIRPFYRRALLVVAPLRFGSGTRLKILEAMAAGTPVISTRFGAEGLHVSDSDNILLADTTGEIVTAAGRLVSSREIRRRLGESGRELVTRLYDWSILGAQLHQIHQGTLDRLRTPNSMRVTD